MRAAVHINPTTKEIHAMNTTEDSAAMDTKDKCPNCGAGVRSESQIHPTWQLFQCGTLFGEKPTLYCQERAARQKAEAERDEALKELYEERSKRHRLLRDFETLAHELECDCNYPFAGLRDSSGEPYSAKLNRLRDHFTFPDTVEAVEELERTLDLSDVPHPSASEFKSLMETRRKLEEAMRCLDGACVVETNTTDRRMWVTYSGWLASGDSLCEVALPPKNTESNEEK